MRTSRFFIHLDHIKSVSLINLSKQDFIPFKNIHGHPSLLIIEILETPSTGSLALEAAGLHRLSDETKWQFLTAICIASHSESDAEFICLLPTHLSGSKAMIRRCTINNLSAS